MWHPAKEADDVATDVEIEDAQDPIPRSSRRAPRAIDVPPLVVDSGTDGLHFQDCDIEAQYIDERVNGKILQRSH
ncbi:hypothetical protein AXF42_Ash009962 [Apostasia shenzhenica]|uniref:Uncharacterized protein n=1 Tax=Apostasia shenzhenica TaxID=1088818 RepID=A0A2I0ACF3_9ASPA|nr:hypothetical protein AXF42_Ash009962 [Apostasia shenzhenica]